jgi:hypothetical protein
VQPTAMMVLSFWFCHEGASWIVIQDGEEGCGS